MLSAFPRFIKSKTFLINIILLVAFLLLIVFSINGWLSHFTLHGQSISVPDLRGMPIKKADRILTDNKLQYKVVDSLFDLTKPPGAVLDQDPAFKSKVKEDRTIYLTINSTNPPNVKMPDLIDVSYRQATAMLESFGLTVGEISYRSDLAKNAVLAQRYRNNNIKAGTKIPKGSAINLVLGDGLENSNLNYDDNDIVVPDLSGKTYREAIASLRASSLSTGLVHYDNVADSATAKIFKQSPEAGEGSVSGHPVDLFLK